MKYLLICLIVLMGCNSKHNHDERTQDQINAIEITYGIESKLISKWQITYKHLFIDMYTVTRRFNTEQDMRNWLITHSTAEFKVSSIQHIKYKQYEFKPLQIGEIIYE